MQEWKTSRMLYYTLKHLVLIYIEVNNADYFLHRLVQLTHIHYTVHVQLRTEAIYDRKMNSPFQYIIEICKSHSIILFRQQ